MSRSYNKPTLTYAQQIAHLRANGMEIADEPAAEAWLKYLKGDKAKAVIKSFGYEV